MKNTYCRNVFVLISLLAHYLNQRIYSAIPLQGLDRQVRNHFIRL